MHRVSDKDIHPGTKRTGVQGGKPVRPLVAAAAALDESVIMTTTMPDLGIKPLPSRALAAKARRPTTGLAATNLVTTAGGGGGGGGGGAMPIGMSKHAEAEYDRRKRINDGLDRLRLLIPNCERASTFELLYEAYAHIIALREEVARLRHDDHGNDNDHDDEGGSNKKVVKKPVIKVVGVVGDGDRHKTIATQTMGSSALEEEGTPRGSLSNESVPPLQPPPPPAAVVVAPWMMNGGVPVPPFLPFPGAWGMNLVPTTALPPSLASVPLPLPLPQKKESSPVDAKKKKTKMVNNKNNKKKEPSTLGKKRPHAAIAASPMPRAAAKRPHVVVTTLPPSLPIDKASLTPTPLAPHETLPIPLDLAMHGGEASMQWLVERLSGDGDMVLAKGEGEWFSVGKVHEQRGIETTMASSGAATASVLDLLMEDDFGFLLQEY